MLPTLLPIGALLSGIVLLLLGTGLLSTLLALRGSLEGFTDSTLGLIGSSYFLGFFLGTFIAPCLIRRMGHIRAFAFFGASVAVCILLHALIVDALFWMLLRALTGIALVGFYAVIESWLNEQTTTERRGQVFAVYMAVHLLALAAAQQLLRIDSALAFTLFAVAAIFACLSLLPVTMTRLPQPQVSDSPRFSLRMVWRAAPAAFIGALSSGIGMGAFWSLSPIYGQHIGLEAGGIAMLMSSTILGGALLQWPIGHLSDRIDRRHALVGVASIAALTPLLMLLFESNELAVLAGFFVFGGAAFTIYPIVVAHLVDHLHPQDILAGNTGVLFLHGAGAAIGPLLAGLLLDYRGASGLLLHFGIAFIPLALFTLFQVRQGRDVIVDEAAEFSPMLRTTPAVLDLVTPDEDFSAPAPDDHATVEDSLATAPAPAAPATTTPSAEPAADEREPPAAASAHPA